MFGFFKIIVLCTEISNVEYGTDIIKMSATIKEPSSLTVEVSNNIKFGRLDLLTTDAKQTFNLIITNTKAREGGASQATVHFPTSVFIENKNGATPNERIQVLINNNGNLWHQSSDGNLVYQNKKIERTYYGVIPYWPTINDIKNGRYSKGIYTGSFVIRIESIEY